MSVIKNPIEQFFDLDGSPLSGGYLYFGSVNGNPETTTTQVYWDSAFTIPAPQPIRTVNGYASRLGSPASIYTINDVSITVKNKKSELVFYLPTSSQASLAQNIVTRTSNTILLSGDIGKTILASGTFTQTFDASVALGSGWSVTYVNNGTGTITLDPNLSELIDGSSYVQIFPNKACIITCDGIGLTTTLVPVDTTPIVKGSADATKQLRFEVDGLTTGTTRTATFPDKNITVAGTDDVSAAIPAGARFAFTGTSAPAGYLVCPTAQTNISRTTYAALFANIGTTWGAGDGSTTFGMPWFPADYSPVQANSNVGSQTVGQVISHSHAGSVGTTSGTGYPTSQPSGLIIGNISAFGASANFAAGVRELFIVKY